MREVEPVGFRYQALGVKGRPFPLFRMTPLRRLTPWREFARILSPSVHAGSTLITLPYPLVG